MKIKEAGAGSPRCCWWSPVCRFCSIGRGASVPLMIAHRIMGCSLASTGDLVDARVHFDCAVALYDPAAHRPLAARFGQDNRVTSLAYGSVVVWLLGYPDAGYAYAESAVKNARELGQAAALMYSLFHTSLTTIFSGRYEASNARLDELVGLAEEKNAAFWRAGGTTHRGCALAMTGKAADALHMINTGMTALRSTGRELVWSLGNSTMPPIGSVKRGSRCKPARKAGGKPR